jgi:hypothetical protein
MLAKTPTPTTAELIEQIVDGYPPFPKFPEAFGPRDMSNRTYTGKMKSVDLEISRVIVRNKMRALARKGTV